MHNLLAVPSPVANDAIVNLADWVELKAVLSTDGTVSREDLSRALCRGESMNDTATRDMAVDVFSELQNRATLCDYKSHRKIWSVYPFSLAENQTLLTLHQSYDRRADCGLIYLFLLGVSLADMDSKSRILDGLDPTKVFERMCGDVLSSFWGGPSNLAGAFVFGTARSKRKEAAPPRSHPALSKQTLSCSAGI